MRHGGVHPQESHTASDPVRELFHPRRPRVARIMNVIRAFIVGAAVAMLAGCAATERPDVERVASDFATGDPTARCALLAPATLAEVERDGPCVSAVGPSMPSGAQVLQTSVWGDEAQVRLSGDTLFLTRTGSGWKVAAAGCAPNGDLPYECRLEGP
jgi:hypothetical protein